jgi:beta-lactamase class A
MGYPYDTIVFMYSEERPRTKRRPIGCLIILLFIISAGIYSAVTRFAGHRVISPLPDDTDTHRSLFRLFVPVKNADDLKGKIKSFIGSEWNNYSVYIVDLSSSFSMGINETTIVTGASLNKVPLFAALYSEAQKGTVDFDRVITLQKDDIQDYGTGSIRYDTPGSTYTVKTLVRLSAQQSDNTATHLLANYIIGLPAVQKYVDSWGMIQTDMVNNKTSNKDMALIFQKLYRGEVANKALTTELLGFLTDSDFENRLPALLPKGTVVYHKIGTGQGVVHDAGIVINGKTKYYVGILTENITDEAAATKKMAELSKLIYDYMSSH